jgi:hypothetical protein
MEGITEFLMSTEAEWLQMEGQDNFMCKNKDIKTRLDGIRNDLPLPLQISKDLRAWKTTGTYRIKSSAGFILPIKIISGEPKLYDGTTTKTLAINSDPIQIKKGDVISGNLYFIAGS